MMVLTACGIWKYGSINSTGTCYDNVWADMVLGGGDKPAGVYGYVDVFTWYGLVKVVAFSSAVWFLREFLFTTFTAFWMAVVLWMTPDIVICEPGEFVYWGWDVCVSVLGGSDKESGLQGIWEAEDLTIENMVEEDEEGESVQKTE